MKRIILFFLITSAWYIVEAQDFILTKKSEVIEAKVVEVGLNEVKYKKWNYLDGPNYSISKDAISKITYQNGDVEVFEITKNVSSHNTSNEPSQQESYSYSSSMISSLSRPSKNKSKSKCDTCYKYEKFNFSMFFGPNLSVGEFAQNDEDYLSAIYIYGTELSSDLKPAGASKVGAFLGFNLHFPIFNKKHHTIGLDLKSDLQFTTLSQVSKENFEKYEIAFLQDFSDYYYNAAYGINAYKWMTGRYSSYWNYGLKLGLNYTYYFNKNIALLLNGNLGLQLNMVSRTKLLNMMGGTYITTEYVEEYGQYARLYSSDGMYYKYKPSCSFVYEIGGGVLLGDAVSLSVLYSAGSAHKHNMELLEYSNKKLDRSFKPVYVETQKLRIQYLALQIGFHF